jgi:preprotein translocase subunit YajC
MTKMSSLLSMSSFLAQTAAPVAQPQQQGSMLMSFLPMVLIMGAMYFILIAPQRKKQKEHEKMMRALQSGDEVVTTGGIFGVITNVKEDRFIVRIAENTKIEVGKGFIQSASKRTDEKK